MVSIILYNNIKTIGSPLLRKFNKGCQVSSPLSQNFSDLEPNIKFANEGTPQKELDKEKAIERQRKKENVPKKFRRKSCECSECGGLSKLEQKTSNIIVSTKRQIERSNAKLNRKKALNNNLIIPSKNNQKVVFQGNFSAILS